MKPAGEGQRPRKRSLFRGVSAHGNKWKAQINHAGTQYYLGLFEQEEDAARAYDRAARIIHAHNAVVNFQNSDTTEKPQEKLRNPSNRLPRDANPALLGVLFRHPRDDGARRCPVALGHHAQDVELLMNYRAEMQERIFQLQGMLQNPVFPMHFRDNAMDDFVACSIREMDASTRIDELLHVQAQSVPSRLTADRTLGKITRPGNSAHSSNDIQAYNAQGASSSNQLVADIPYLRPHQVSGTSSSSAELEPALQNVQAYSRGRPHEIDDTRLTSPIRVTRTLTSSDDQDEPPLPPFQARDKDGRRTPDLKIMDEDEEKLKHEQAEQN